MPGSAPLLIVSVAFCALLLTASLHELAHIIPSALLRNSAFSAQYPGWASLIPTAAGPASTWACLLGACWVLLRKQDVAVDSTRFIWMIAIAASAGYRFVFIGLVGILHLALSGTIRFRNDEYKIGSMVGIPFELLVMGQLVLTLICWTLIFRRYRGHIGLGQMTSIVLGLVLGVGAWTAVAYGFDIPMMK